MSENEVIGTEGMTEEEIAALAAKKAEEATNEVVAEESTEVEATEIV